MKMLLVTLATLWSVLGQECGCTSDEVCCKDDPGYECCIVQSTTCVPASYRCCLKGTVGCTGGSVGCCDPTQMWQRLLELYAAAQPHRSTRKLSQCVLLPSSPCFDKSKSLPVQTNPPI
ncbi:hypothetical protein DIPPA_27019 [Diplonema papillatum]|nr:hypothetical protein DIPPA_27019 [Diplonema papillatum]